VSPFIKRLFLVLFTSATSIAFSQSEESEKAIPVLIVDGFSNHDWKASTQAIKAILRSDPLIQIDISTVPPEKSDTWAAWNPDFQKYAVVIQNTNDISKKGSWPRPAQQALEEYLSQGGGMLVFHSGNNAFKNWKAYNEMIGLGWRNKDFGPSIQIVHDKPVTIPSGEGDSTGHGKRFDALVTRLGEHPIHTGLPKQFLAADLEVYRYARGPAENLTVLSYAKEPQTELNFPIEWVVNYGKGRVYCSTFGHYWHKLKPPFHQQRLSISRPQKKPLSRPKLSPIISRVRVLEGSASRMRRGEPVLLPQLHPPIHPR